MSRKKAAGGLGVRTNPGRGRQLKAKYFQHNYHPRFQPTTLMKKQMQNTDEKTNRTKRDSS